MKTLDVSNAGGEKRKSMKQAKAPGLAWPSYVKKGFSMSTGPFLNSVSELYSGSEQRRRPNIKRRKVIRRMVLGLFLLIIGLLGLHQYTNVFSSPQVDLNSVSKEDGWAMYRRDLSRSGSTDPDGTIPQGTLKWAFSTGDIIHSSAAVANGIVYFGSRNGKLYALNAATGAKLWDFKTGSWVESSPAIENGVVYFGSNDGALYALDALSGKKLWQFEVRFGVLSSPAVADGKIYFGCDDYYIYALDSKEGTKLWHFETDNRIPSSPAVANGILYIGSTDGFLYALNAKNGRPLLKFKSYAPIVSSPSVYDGTVYVGTTRGYLYAIDSTARNWFLENKLLPYWKVLYLYGDLPKPPQPSGYLWSLRLGGVTSSSPVVIDDRLYIGAGSRLLAIDISNHKVLWAFNTGAWIESSPAVSGTTVYVGSNDGRLYALDAISGNRLWEIRTEDRITSSPVVADGTVYVGSHDGNLYAIK